MNVTKHDSYLTKHELEALSSFTSILLKVSSRVSTHKLGSESYDIGEGLLDKVEIKLTEKFSVHKIVTRCKESGFYVEGKYLQDKKFYLEIQTAKGIIYCLLGVPENKEFNKIIFNPSKSHSLISIVNILSSLIGPNVINSKLLRLDFTVDYFEKYEQILKGLDVSHKSSNVEFMNGSIKTGILIGKGDDKLLVYNKSKKERVSKPWTRIERQVRTSKLPVKTLEQLLYGYDAIYDFNPLGIVTLNHCEFVTHHNFSQKETERFHEVKTLIHHEGYFLTRKKLNKHNNFHRDYSQFFTLTPYKVQPSQIFQQSLLEIYKED